MSGSFGGFSDEDKVKIEARAAAVRAANAPPDPSKITQQTLQNQVNASAARQASSRTLFQGAGELLDPNNNMMSLASTVLLGS